MKIMRAVGALLVMTGALWGQSRPTAVEEPRVKPPIIVVFRTCDEIIEFHGHSKAIEDIFPEACGRLVDNALPAKPSDVLRFIEKDRWSHFPPSCPAPTADQSYGISEPSDVPAIQVSREEEYGDANWCNTCTQYSCTAMNCDPHAKHTVTETTCADKSRVLLTAEDGTKHCVRLPSKAAPDPPAQSPQ